MEASIRKRAPAREYRAECLAYEPLTTEQARDLWEVLDDRYGRGATLVTSQVPVGQWHSLIPDATTADAILDRLVHQAYRVELKGDSLRKHLPSPD